MSRRTEQLASVLHRAVQSVLTEGLADPRLTGLLTVTEVRVSDDLSEAVVSVSIFPEKKEDLSMHALRDASAHIRRRAGELVALARPPRLTFKLDRRLKREASVLQTLAALREEAAPETGDGPSTRGTGTWSAGAPKAPEPPHPDAEAT